MALGLGSWARVRMRGWSEGWSEGDNGEQGVSYEMFVVPLVKAVQELSAKNDALAAEVEQLKSQLNN